MSNYFCQTESHSNFKLAEKIPGTTSEIFCNLAKELGVVLNITMFEKKTSGFYHNTSIIIGENGNILSKYRKMHIPDDPGYYEKFYFSPGDLGFKSVKTKFGKIGPLICWDQWFPETARVMALMGAEILLYPTAIGSELDRPDLDSKNHWQNTMCGHAAANIMPVIASNRIGKESSNDLSMEFYGSSFISNHLGELVSEADRESEKIITHTFDLDLITQYRRDWGVYRDRRTDLYNEILTLDGNKT